MPPFPLFHINYNTRKPAPPNQLHQDARNEHFITSFEHMQLLLYHLLPQ